MPFIGPAIAVWVALTVGVMSYYFLVVARAPRARNLPPAPRREPYQRAETRPVRPWIHAPAPDTAQPWIPTPAPAPTRSDLPAYDMEHFPEDKWGGPQSAA
jgi:hypothetical protein